MQTRKLGTGGPRVSAIGLGCMGMTEAYGPARDEDGIATIHAALDAGVNLIDTGDFYAMGLNELLVGRALRGRAREQAVVSVKFGGMRTPGRQIIGYDARPAAVKNFLSYSLNRLGLDHIDIYRPARLDPQVPVEETIGAIAECVEAGWVRHIGLSEVGADTIRRAAAVHPICDLQIEYSLISRGIEQRILPATRELGISLTAYGVLSRGLLSGRWSAARELAPGDFRAHAPRFAAGNVERNLELVEELRKVADELGASVAQVAIAWVASRGADIVPLIGARTPARLEEALGGLELQLTPGQLAAIERAVPPDAAHGERYPAAGMATLDSEV